MLGMIKLTFVEIRTAILAVDDAKVDENTLIQFANYVPTPDEIKLLEPYKQDLDKLAAADNFFLVVSWDASPGPLAPAPLIEGVPCSMAVVCRRVRCRRSLASSSACAA